MNRDEFTIAEHHFKTTDGLHTLYVHEWGNPDGKPILYIHGGPGNGCGDKHRLIFDPNQYRVIFLDQRGAGKSTPTGSLENNTTDYLIEDIELIRKKLKIDKWLVTGNSWGSTLSLCYGIKHPENIKRMIISGVWLSTEEEMNWLFNGGWKNSFPELWECYLSNTPAEHREKPGDYHLKNAFDKSATSKKSLFQLGNVEFTLLHLDENKMQMKEDDFDVDSMGIEMHYMKNKCFISDSYIMNNVDKLTMPIDIIQGRYDMVCAPKSAYDLHNSLPNSTLTWTLDGHVFSRNSRDVTAQTLKLI